ncbi:MAG: 3-hydroxyacyl-CoA dehydrogenase NAD-binding domain-containing protein [Roseobacter sp.]
MAVQIHKTGGLAYVTIDNPPVNAASQAVRIGLMAAISDTESDDTVLGVILRAAGRTFTAGADVTEFDKPPVEPHLPDVILALENTTKPWIAALHGNILGGGLEIALGCHYRVAHIKSKLGMPEVTLGLIPGAGGTVRLPRLVDPMTALTMISDGNPVKAAKARDIGLIDEIALNDATEDAISLAQHVVEQPLPIPLSKRSPRPIENPAMWEAAKAKILKRARRAIAPQKAVASVQSALESSADNALLTERKTFMDLKSNAQCTALRRVFFAERSAAKLPSIEGVPPLPLDKIGVVGGGTMGAGISAACLLRGLRVTMIERDTDAEAAGRDRVLDILANSLRRGLTNQADHAAMCRSFTTSTRYTALSEADVVIEAVFEDMSVKKEVISALDQALHRDAIIASNTSYLDINAMAAFSKNPSRVIGLHFFSPAYIMKLVEVIVTNQASATSLATGFALAKRLGKIAVPSGVCDGFIGNRIMSAYRSECELMVEDGAMPWDVDAAMREFGFPMGVFEMQDLAGLDISWAMRKRKSAALDPSERYVNLGDRLCEAGRFGRKSNAGWYDYADGKSSQSKWVATQIMMRAQKKGIQPVKIPHEAIITRILKAMHKEAIAILEEGIASRVEDIDVVMINGYGFPRWRGGPMFMKDARL